jgi:CheY-like chemotaxis protein
MQTNIARAADYDQPRAAGPALTTILVVDDDTTARLTIAAMISNEDEYRVILGTGAAEARERLPSIEPDVIVCDFVMDGVSGDEFFRWLKADRRWRYVPIIAVTRLDNPQVRADLLNAGADAIAAKPINAPELRAMVFAAARTRRQYQNLMREGS